MVTAKEMGKKGGQAKSKAKTEAARKNASNPRGKWVTFVHFGVKLKSGDVVDGCFSWRGKLDLDMNKNGQMLQDLVTEELLISGHGVEWKELVRFGGIQTKVV